MQIIIHCNICNGTTLHVKPVLKTRLLKPFLRQVWSEHAEDVSLCLDCVFSGSIFFYFYRWRHVYCQHMSYNDAKTPFLKCMFAENISPGILWHNYFNTNHWLDFCMSYLFLYNHLNMWSCWLERLCNSQWWWTFYPVLQSHNYNSVHRNLLLQLLQRLLCYKWSKWIRQLSLKLEIFELANLSPKPVFMNGLK